MLNAFKKPPEKPSSIDDSASFKKTMYGFHPDEVNLYISRLKKTILELEKDMESLSLSASPESAHVMRELEKCVEEANARYIEEKERFIKEQEITARLEAECAKLKAELKTANERKAPLEADFAKANTELGKAAAMKVRFENEYNKLLAENNKLKEEIKVVGERYIKLETEKVKMKSEFKRELEKAKEAASDSVTGMAPHSKSAQEIFSELVEFKFPTEAVSESAPEHDLDNSFMQNTAQASAPAFAYKRQKAEDKPAPEPEPEVDPQLAAKFDAALAEVEDIKRKLANALNSEGETENYNALLADAEQELQTLLREAESSNAVPEKYYNIISQISEFDSALDEDDDFSSLLIELPPPVQEKPAPKAEKKTPAKKPAAKKTPAAAEENSAPKPRKKPGPKPKAKAENE